MPSFNLKSHTSVEDDGTGLLSRRHDSWCAGCRRPSAGARRGHSERGPPVSHLPTSRDSNAIDTCGWVTHLVASLLWSLGNILMAFEACMKEREREVDIPATSRGQGDGSEDFASIANATGASWPSTTRPRLWRPTFGQAFPRRLDMLNQPQHSWISQDLARVRSVIL